jgi:predicted nucleic acid-binding protein
LIATDLTVDASVWVAVLDGSDTFHEESRAFLAAVTVEGSRPVIPAFAVAEIACALARKLRSPVAARRLAQQILQVSEARRVPVDTALIAAALRLGTDTFLRGADALYAATAQVTGSTLVSWDQELIRQAGAISPTDWLGVNR